VDRDWSVGAPRVKTPCTHLLDHQWSRERAVAMVWIKRDRFPVKFLQVFISEKSLRIRRRGPVGSKKKTCAIISHIEAHRGNPLYEKAIAIEVAILLSYNRKRSFTNIYSVFAIICAGCTPGRGPPAAILPHTTQRRRSLASTTVSKAVVLETSEISF